MRYVIVFTVIFNIILTNAFHQEACEKCVTSENCPQFLNMNREEQQRWMSQFPCLPGDQPFYGFTPVARGNYVCCPGTNVWSIVNEEPGRRNNLPYDQSGINRPTMSPNVYPPFGWPNFQTTEPPNFGYTQRPGGRQTDFIGNPSINNQYPNYVQPGQPAVNNQYPPCPNNQFGNYQNPMAFQNPNCNYYQSGPKEKNYPNNKFPTDYLYPTPVYPSTYPPQNMFPVYPPNNAYPHNNGHPNFPGNIGHNIGVQCQVPSALPPNPESGCCGLDMSSGQGMTDLKNIVTQRLRNPMFFQNNIRLKRETGNETVGIELDDRIAGGTETELNQFPWTALLKVTFDFGVNKTTFNCGGSVLSARYVLTAAHCIYEKGARISELEIYLAEYDKRTFPRDCKLNFRGERTCIDNVLVFADSIIRHPDYDEKKLYADIALIRLHGNAPYTEFIRPICLPPTDVDNEVFYGLPLPVAGWGRNGPYMSSIKQSTVVNLVPHDECQKYYPNLSPSHLCAAGKTGEDTCKGDSGGPLMMLYGGKYYVVGVVSGKRADSPCGTSVPSLYTNVFQYIQWIRDNIN